ncbi:MurR/RpiR family transcriptional regulator [Mesomycoplasma hyorhinis]|uniref:MurR/RpiR family transcriptional regulator n=1 Tax=Mesomycoplasma hyorhinis TaxID=2100 RepID=UPI001C05486A|nr:MurR/RpiR family transcriptional regulator [Mesomycoplasma hyorhinis]
MENILKKLEDVKNSTDNLVFSHIASYLLSNLNNIDTMKIGLISKHSDVSNGSVSKFIKHLGFKGVKDFLPELKQQLKFYGVSSDACKKPLEKNSRYLQYHNLIKSNLDYIFEVNQESILKAVELLKRYKYILLFGRGANLAVINVYANYLSKLNYFVNYSFDLDVQKKWTENANENSLCIFFSFSSLTPNIEKIFTEIKQKGNIKTILFTANKDSMMAKRSDVILLTKNNEDLLLNHTNSRIGFNYLFMQILNLLA